MTKEDYLGKIASITEDLLYLELPSGQKVRLALEMVQTKRCEMKPFLRGSAALESVQTTGWAECEPF